MSTESRELVLYATNDGNLYRQRTQPIIANLARKIARGTYDSALALKAWQYLADDAARAYTREFDSREAKGFGCFTKPMRVEAAKKLADYYSEALSEAALDLAAKERR